MSAGQPDQYQKVTSFAGGPPEYSPGRGPDWSAAGVRKGRHLRSLPSTRLTFFERELPSAAFSEIL